MCQILELLDQNPWRNNLSKLATFNSIFQLTHSALIHYVKLCPGVCFILNHLLGFNHKAVEKQHWSICVEQVIG